MIPVSRFRLPVPCLLLLFLPQLASADDPDYDLVVSAAPKLRTGKKGSVSLSIVPRTGRRLLRSAPVLVRLKGQGIQLARTLFLREHAADPNADVPRFEIPFTVEKTGRLEAAVSFYVCQGRRCRPVEEQTHWSIDIEGSP